MNIHEMTHPNNGEPVFKKEFLQYYKVVPELKEGDTVTAVIRVGFDVRPDKVREGRTGLYWNIPLRCGTEKNLKEIEKILFPRIMCDFSEISHLLMWGVIFDSPTLTIDSLPVKGEEVICNFEMKDGEMCCTNVVPLPKFNLKNYKPKTFETLQQLIEEFEQH